MPGFELIGLKEKKALTKLIDDGGILFAHGFDNIRKNYHVREFEKVENHSSHKINLEKASEARKGGRRKRGQGDHSFCRHNQPHASRKGMII